MTITYFGFRMKPYLRFCPYSCLRTAFPFIPGRYYSLCFLLLCAASGIFILWYAVNSDRNYVHPILTQLIPAGQCSCKTSTTFKCSSCSSCLDSYFPLSRPSSSSSLWRFEYPRDANNQGLDSAQCRSAFPGLFEDVFRAASFWKSHNRGLSTADLDSITIQPGMARAFITNGELYVVQSRAKGEHHRRKILAVLSSIYRALISDPHRSSFPLPASSPPKNIEFIFSVEDKVDDVASADHPLWVLSRTALEDAVWLMPDFGFWAWNNPSNIIGPYDQIVEQIQQADSLPFESKTKQLVWRGKPSFAPKLRRALMDASRGQPWADVKQVEWNEKTNFMSMEDHCRYMFIAHVEGRAYSASLKYRQACNSVVVAHELQYIQHHHYLLVPSGPNQNYVQVNRNFTDLADKLEPLLSNTEHAKRIAINSVRTFRERYLTLAAETCYWRALFNGYADIWNGSVASNDNNNNVGDVAMDDALNPSHRLLNQEQPQQRGLRYESFVLLESPLMMDFHGGL